MLESELSAPGIDLPDHAIFLALDTDPRSGSAVVPFARGAEGSTVFLPFRANRIYVARMTATGPAITLRRWDRTMWSDSVEVTCELEFSVSPGRVKFAVHDSELDGAAQIGAVIYAKDLRENDGWGRLLPNPDLGAPGGFGDQYLPRFKAIDLAAGTVSVQSRLGAERIRIYQLLPRLFGNVNERREPNGTLAENGVGKFNDINDAALAAIREMGVTHVWLTGILRQATATDHSAIGLPADDPDLLKGLAGSPYAIKDAFDVCPDYAVNPAERLAEFRALLARIHARGMRTIIDFVPNHVARSYASTIAPDLSFGATDDVSKFFDPQNNFFHLHGQPLQLPTWRDGVPISPTCQVLGTCDGRFDGEHEHARVTGNNVASPTPSLHDWYETVKLNYGYDFSSRERAYPNGADRDRTIPDTWLKMDRVLAHWQEVGVDGFRCDMAHMVPAEFWAWAIGRARARKADVLLIAEAYDSDPMKVPTGEPLLAKLNGEKGHVMFDLLSAGFDAVYDDPSYKTLKSIYDGGGWANDLDSALGPDFIFQNSLRYSENHDEVRLAGRDHWGNVGMAVGRPVSAVLYGLSRGPLLLYSGQEVGEPAVGPTGFGGDNARTTIFDYWSMPELAKWVNGHAYDGGHLSPEQRELRVFYTRLVHLAGEPAFRDGEFFGLNPANISNEHFGRLHSETASGHWLYAFLRSAPASGQSFLVIANFHRSETMRDVHVFLPPDAIDLLEIAPDAKATLVERLSRDPWQIEVNALSAGVTIAAIPPLTPFYFELRSARK